MAVNVTLSLQLVTAQVKVESAVKSDEDKETETKTVCEGDPDKGFAAHAAAKVNARYRCSSCGREHSSYHPYPRGRDNADGTYTVIPQAELDAAKAGEDKTVFTQINLVPVDRATFEENMVPSGKVYYLKPKGAVLPYAAIREAIRLRPDDVFVSEWAYRTAVNVVRVVLMGDVIAIQQYAWQDAVLPKPVIPQVDLAPEMLALATQVVDGARIEWDPARFTDIRKSTIAKLLAEASGGDSPAAPARDDANSLMAELEAFLASQAAPAPVKKARKPRTKKPAAV